MPRPKSDLERYLLMLAPGDVAELEQIARDAGLLTDAGEPSRSAAARHLIRAERARRERKRARAEKIPG